ncbi:hypothetical protein BDA99DRAFT_547913 [Phascolomyces articulosus]|uniref:Polysaccharide lyase 14 domain-containing protein n=1 Tax=Phascolomyces articulosus TaxID=60185 RepID=A0AAD5K5B8_9FUNG|nr:hypothetical protein BDA99DRAFT_547913 [Phascolomyces articulosus]
MAVAQDQSWSFKNWNKYKSQKKSPAGETEGWFKAWGIPKEDGWAWPHKGESVTNHEIVKDPANKKEQVLKVNYPKGSNSPNSDPQGGVGFYAQPFKLKQEAKTLVFEYKVYFPKKFQFVKGGKLPGLYGGHEGCSGGADATTCFSTRFMWRRDGEGEIYAYLPESKQRDSLCDEKGNICNSDYGYSLGRGSWKFKTGDWNTVRQTLKLNSPGKDDGSVTVEVDGKTAYTEKNVAFLNKNTGKVVGVAFHTFFGGSGSEWAPKKKESTYFKGFSLKAHY